MKTKIKTITMLILTILMLFTMAFWGQIASAEETSAEETSGSENLFDMELFNEENRYNISTNFTYSLVDEQGLVLRLVYSEIADNALIYSGDFYIRSGTYTLSFFVEGFDFQTYDFLLRIYTAEANQAIDVTTVTNNDLKTITFAVEDSTYYSLRIKIENILTAHDPMIISVNDIMLNEGSEPLPFEPYIQTNDEIDVINNQTDNILQKLDDLFGINSGLVAGASLGTVILLLLFLYLFMRVR